MKHINLDISIEESKLPFFLELIKNLDFVSVSKSSDWYDDLSENDLEKIQQGLNDLNNGNTLSHEQVMLNAKNKIQQLKNV